MGPLFSAGLLVLLALAATLVLFVFARMFLPTRRAIALAIALVASGAVGGAAAALMLAPFFAGETLTSTSAVISYFSVLLGGAISFAVLGGLGYRKWSRQSNSALLTDAYASPLRAQRGAAKRER
jgi:hypothetical protein